MTWQEYQEAVGALYAQMDDIGTIERNVSMVDRITGSRRQIDTLIRLNFGEHELLMVVDAKFYSKPIDVKVVEEVAALADAVGAHKSIIVAANGWNESAQIKASHLRCDLKLWSLEEALEFFVEDMWMICPYCEKDCIVMDQDGVVGHPFSGGWIWWLGGGCRKCSYALVWCQDCGIKFGLALGESRRCDCGYQWENEEGQLFLTVLGENEDGSIEDVDAVPGVVCEKPKMMEDRP